MEAPAAVLVAGLVVLADRLVSQEHCPRARQRALATSLDGHFPEKGDLVYVSVTARRLTAAAAVGALALPAAAAGQHPARPHHDVVISNVQYDSPGRDDRSNRSLNSEWVDVTSTTRRAVNLDGRTLSDEVGHTYTFRRVRPDGRSTVRVRKSSRGCRLVGART